MKKYILHRSINLFIVFLGILTTGGFTSCNFLRVDDYFDDTMKFDSIFTKYVMEAGRILSFHMGRESLR